MEIWFKKIDESNHQMRVQREDGSLESAVCETRSLLNHDLTHFALESEANLDGGFYGLLSSGKTFSELRDLAKLAAQNENLEIMGIEKVVAVLQSLCKGVSVDTVLEQVFHGTGEAPLWLTENIVRATEIRLKSLLGHWRATKFGEEMQITWTSQ